MVDRLAENYHILQVTPQEQFLDQYGVKPTESTMAAIVNIIHTVIVLFENNKYVRCLLVNFSKAFDTVDHFALVQNKNKTYNIGDNIIDLVVSFLTDRDQYKKMRDSRSFTRVINRSNVQGSRIRPKLFIIFISDWRKVGLANRLTKYAGDA